ncbi:MULTISPECIES: GNAT family N-acetyltransferase [unclassified Fusibacter]|uniref:GNAT family N-acetyltransferase n=1 Tax=unclassified Fusibacter TaxID=2624464 RepID=UPI0010109BC4|nr:MULTISPECIES: GNAT family N-acetyltransferase [unclassified Fusibacter]MCK8059715.1 GNAT family N-acetyltransferase [Fusibacter sp. A2]NPE21516.1 GNAT family N-acetyltransferase [Fusibacter sp. A1]RXV61926.1 GNAT family N-acetyltransferase [Fusibacter sp. A1]
MHYKIKGFNQLTTKELYDILKLRQDVFILEQACLYPDIDGKDQASYHVLGYMQKDLVAYARILPPGLSYPETSIGRVVTAASQRGKGLGLGLMTACIDYIDSELKESSIRISAQAYLMEFYQSLGFKQVSQEYLEDDIPHMEMLRGE